MAAYREIELKLEINPTDAERLRSISPLATAPCEKQLLDTIYFDTPEQSLRRAGFTLRVRRTPSGIVQTIKAQSEGAGLFDRCEWESPIKAMKPNLNAARATPVRELLPAHGKLLPFARMQFERTSWEVQKRATHVEVTLDEGSITADGATQAINELELELRDGPEKALFDLCDEIRAYVPVRLSVLSKADRASALAKGRFCRPFKASRVKVSAGMTISEGFSAIVLSCLQHLRLNEPILIAKRLPEALHQLRVATRRLRSAFSLFESVVGKRRRYQRIVRELRAFSRKLGAARNLDIFLAMLDEAHETPARIQHNREKAYDRVIATLESANFQRLILGIVRWLSIGDWRDRRDARLPLSSYIEWKIDKLWLAVSEEGSRLRSMSDRRRHRFRIRVKHFRYTLEFARELHRTSKSARAHFIGVLEALQDQLGFLNDLAVASKFAQDNGLHLAKVDDPGARSAALEAAEREFAKLVAAPPYWHVRGKC